MVAGKAPQPAKLRVDIKNLEACILEMDNYFTIIQICNELHQLAYVGLYMAGDMLIWWKSTKYWVNTCGEVKDGIREYDADNYKLDRTCNETSDLKQTGTVQKYLIDINRLNVYTKMAIHHLINIFLNGIMNHLHQPMARCEDLRSNLANWKGKLLHMDFINTKLYQKEQDNRVKVKERSVSCRSKYSWGGERQRERRRRKSLS